TMGEVDGMLSDGLDGRPASAASPSVNGAASALEGTTEHAQDARRRTQDAPGWSRRHVLDLDDFSAEEIAEVLDTAEAMKGVLGRRVKKVPALQGKTVLNVFYEASTRTRVSFELAAKHLSADVINMSASG